MNITGVKQYQHYNHNAYIHQTTFVNKDLPIILILST